MVQPNANGFGECVFQFGHDVKFKIAVVASLLFFVVQPVLQALFMDTIRTSARRCDQIKRIVFTQTIMTYSQHLFGSNVNHDSSQKFISDFANFEFLSKTIFSKVTSNQWRYLHIRIFRSKPVHETVTTQVSLRVLWQPVYIKTRVKALRVKLADTLKSHTYNDIDRRNKKNMYKLDAACEVSGVSCVCFEPERGSRNLCQTVKYRCKSSHRSKLPLTLVFFSELSIFSGHMSDFSYHIVCHTTFFESNRSSLISYQY